MLACAPLARRYFLSTALGLFNKKVVGKNYGVFGKGAFPGVCSSGRSSRHSYRHTMLQQHHMHLVCSAAVCSAAFYHTEATRSCGSSSRRAVAAPPPFPHGGRQLTGFLFLFHSSPATLQPSIPKQQPLANPSFTIPACMLPVFPCPVFPVVPATFVLQPHCFSPESSLRFRTYWRGWCLPRAWWSVWVNA